ncbi:MAG: hypothetical protein P9M14_13500 [Candidatus Alcyoniella australis]|nr:hypothetical protein [Candidatus Alcyoniella australis]
MKWPLAVHCILLFIIIGVHCYLLHPVIALSVTSFLAMVIFSYLMVSDPNRRGSEILLLFGLYMVAQCICLAGNGFLLPVTSFEPSMAIHSAEGMSNPPMDFTHYLISQLATSYMIFSWVIVLVIAIKLYSKRI